LLVGQLLLLCAAPAAAQVARPRPPRRTTGTNQQPTSQPVSIRQLQLELVRVRAELARAKVDLAAAKQEAGTQKARADQLRKDLVAATGTGGTGTGRTVVRGAGAVKFVTYPPRKVDGLGLVRKITGKLAGPVRGARQVHLIPPFAAEKLAPIVLEADGSGAAVNVVSRRAGGKKVSMAALQLKEDGLFWTWNRFSLTGMGPALTKLDELQATSMIELRDGARGVAAFQPRPEVIAIVRGRMVRLKRVVEGMTLKEGTRGTGWTVTSPGEQRLQFASEEWNIDLVLDTKAKTVKAVYKSNVGDQVKAVEEEIKDTQGDYTSARKDLLRYSSRSYSSSTLRDSARRRVEMYAERLTALKKTKDDLIRKQRTGQVPSLDECTARIVAPNAVVLYKISFRTKGG